jgi:hypothetical protein
VLTQDDASLAKTIVQTVGYTVSGTQQFRSFVLLVVLLIGSTLPAADTKAAAEDSISVTVGGGNGKIPWKYGYFEVVLPAKLFERNPDENWVGVDRYYRNEATFG